MGFYQNPPESEELSERFFPFFAFAFTFIFLASVTTFDHSLLVHAFFKKGWFICSRDVGRIEVSIVRHLCVKSRNSSDQISGSWRSGIPKTRGQKDGKRKNKVLSLHHLHLLLSFPSPFTSFTPRPHSHPSPFTQHATSAQLSTFT